MSWFFCLALGCSAVAALPAVAAGTAPPAEQTALFEQKVRPLLENHCFKCHSHAAGKSKGGLVLDSLPALLKGGDSGPSLVPGQPDKSLLLKAVRYEDEELRMPPKGKLADDQIAVLAEWVRAGAPWPGSNAQAAAPVRGTITDEDRRWWAFQPVRVPPLPAVRDAAWSANPIDRFVKHRLEAEGLEPAPATDRAVLLRRLVPVYRAGEKAGLSEGWMGS